MRACVLPLFRHPTGADCACSSTQQWLPAIRVLTKPAASSPTARPQPLGFSAAHRVVPAMGLQLFVAIIAAQLTSKSPSDC